MGDGNIIVEEAKVNNLTDVYGLGMPRNISRYQIDFIMVKNSFINQAKYCRSYPGVDINSDYK